MTMHADFHARAIAHRDAIVARNAAQDHYHDPRHGPDDCRACHTGLGRDLPESPNPEIRTELR